MHVRLRGAPDDTEVDRVRFVGEDAWHDVDRSPWVDHVLPQVFSWVASNDRRSRFSALGR